MRRMRSSNHSLNAAKALDHQHRLSRLLSEESSLTQSLGSKDANEKLIDVGVRVEEGDDRTLLLRGGGESRVRRAAGALLNATG